MGRHKSYERGEVLDRALKLFWEKGYEGAHLQELVKVTGLNRFSLYKEFGSKEGLFEEAFEKYRADLNYLGQILVQEPRGLGNVRRYVEELIKFPWHQGCFAVNALTHHPAVPERNRKQVFKFFKDGEKLIYENLKAAQRNGEIEKDMDIRALANLILSIDIGIIVSHILNPRQEIRTSMVAIVTDRLLATRN